MESSRYRVAPLQPHGGQTLDISTLSFVEAPLSAGVLKGGLGSQDPVEVLKRQGFSALREERPEEALRLFERALRRDRRDRESFRGKAQALARAATGPEQRQRLEAAALRADPSLAEGPEPLLPTPLAPSAPPAPEPAPPPPEDEPLPELDTPQVRRELQFDMGLAVIQGWPRGQRPVIGLAPVLTWRFFPASLGGSARARR